MKTGCPSRRRRHTSYQFQCRGHLSAHKRDLKAHDFQDIASGDLAAAKTQRSSEQHSPAQASSSLRQGWPEIRLCPLKSNLNQRAWSCVLTRSQNALCCFILTCQGKSRFQKQAPKLSTRCTFFFKNSNSTEHIFSRQTAAATAS